MKTMHPATIPSLCLIHLIAMSNVSLLIIDGVLEACLASIYEDQPPPSLRIWLQRIVNIEPKQQAKKVAGDIEDLISSIMRRGVDGLLDWLNDLKLLTTSSEEEDGALASNPLHRSSPLSVYLRRYRMMFAKLTFERAIEWWALFQKWCTVTARNPSYRFNERDEIRSANIADRLQDYQQAHYSRRVYDLGITELRRGKQQIALLHDAFQSFESGGFSAALSALIECAQVARQAGDTECLRACASLSRRLREYLPTTESLELRTALESSLGHGKAIPADCLWEIKLSYSNHTTAVHPVFLNLYASRYLFQRFSEPSIVPCTNADCQDDAWEPSWHTVSSFIWNEIGSSSIKSIRECIALESLTEGQNDWDILLCIGRRRALLLLGYGRYEDALKLAFHIVAVRSRREAMGVLELRGWTNTVWEIVETYRLLISDKDVSSFANRRRPPLPLHWRSVISSPVQHRQALHLQREGCRLMEKGSTVRALSSFLEALQLATLAFSENIRLRCLCHVIECRMIVSPTISEAGRSLAELENVWTSIMAIGSNDKVLQAHAYELRGRCIAIQGACDDYQIELSVPFFREACQVYSSLHMMKALSRTTYLLSRTLDHLSQAPSSSDIKRTWGKDRDIVVRDYQMQQVEHRRMSHDESSWMHLDEVQGIIAAVQQCVLAQVQSEI